MSLVDKLKEIDAKVYYSIGAILLALIVYYYYYKTDNSVSDENKKLKAELEAKLREASKLLEDAEKNNIPIGKGNKAGQTLDHVDEINYDDLKSYIDPIEITDYPDTQCIGKNKEQPNTNILMRDIMDDL